MRDVSILTSLEGSILPRHLILCGFEPNKIMALANRAIMFWEGQSNLRLQMEQQRSALVEKENAKLRATAQEQHTKHVAGISVMQGKILALEKEVETERNSAAGVQARLQHEIRAKRRLEDECALLENRRALRQNFVATALKPSSRMIDNGGVPSHFPGSSAPPVPSMQV